MSKRQAEDYGMNPPKVPGVSPNLADLRLAVAISRFMALPKSIGPPMWWVRPLLERMVRPYTLTEPFDFSTHLREGGSPDNIYGVMTEGGVLRVSQVITPILMNGKMVAVLIMIDQKNRKLFRINPTPYDYGASEKGVNFESYFLEKAPDLFDDLKDTWHFLALWFCIICVQYEKNPSEYGPFFQEYKTRMRSTTNVNAIVKWMMNVGFLANNSPFGSQTGYQFRGSLDKALYTYKNPEGKVIVGQISIQKAAEEFAEGFQLVPDRAGDYYGKAIEKKENTLGFFGDMTEEEKNRGYVMLGMHNIGSNMFRFPPR